MFFVYFSHRELILVGIYLVIQYLKPAVVSDCNTGLPVSKYLVVFDLWETVATADNSGPLVLVDRVARDMWTAVIQDDSIAVVEYLVVLYPTEASFDTKNSLAPRLIYHVVQNNGVCAVVSTKCYVGLIVLENLVFLNVR